MVVNMFKSILNKYSIYFKFINKFNMLALFLFLNSCAYLNYGISDVPSGCEVQGYRRSDGVMHYYLIGDNCNNDIIERIRVQNEKNSRGF